MRLRQKLGNCVRKQHVQRNYRFFRWIPWYSPGIRSFGHALLHFAMRFWYLVCFPPVVCSSMLQFCDGLIIFRVVQSPRNCSNHDNLMIYPIIVRCLCSIADAIDVLISISRDVSVSCCRTKSIACSSCSRIWANTARELRRWNPKLPLHAGEMNDICYLSRILRISATSNIAMRGLSTKVLCCNRLGTWSFGMDCLDSLRLSLVSLRVSFGPLRMWNEFCWNFVNFANLEPDFAAKFMCCDHLV